MQWFYIGLMVLHVFLCVFLVLMVLIQNDKGGGLAGAFGGLGGGAAFTGSSTATFLTTLTFWLAAAFIAVIIGLNILGNMSNSGVRTESELKGPRKGLSAVIPSTPGIPAGGAGGSIPGLGTTPEGQGSGEAPKGQ